MRFKKDDVLIHEDENYQCIISDESIAVLAPHHIFVDEDDDLVGRTNYAELFAVSNYNNTSDGFEYKKVNP